MSRIVVIGGGAAGFFGAIAAAENGGKVTLLEAGRQPLSKVKISGGGRCNVTHACFDPALLVQAYPRGGKELRGALTRFQPRDTIEWFESRGVKLKTEADGRMFPTSDRSQTIIDCLLTAAQQARVELRTQTRVTALGRENSEFVIELKKGEPMRSDRLLLATGSNPLGYQWAASLGHRVIPPIPSLFTFNLPDPRLQDLAGISLETVRLRLIEKGKERLEQTGGLLITHWGISGPAVLKLSAWHARTLHDKQYQLPLEINWLPSQTPETLREQLLKAKDSFPRRQISNYCPVSLPRRLWQQFINQVGIGEKKRWAEISKRELERLTLELTRGRYQIQGKGIFKDEFVTCGGVSLKEVDFKTMESRLVPGLYFAGEILDIDGITGGFNFQSAWTTGWIAGKAMAQEITVV